MKTKKEIDLRSTTSCEKTGVVGLRKVETKIMVTRTENMMIQRR